jgi:hypothetical protein
MKISNDTLAILLTIGAFVLIMLLSLAITSFFGLGTFVSAFSLFMVMMSAFVIFTALKNIHKSFKNMLDVKRTE